MHMLRRSEMDESTEPQEVELKTCGTDLRQQHEEFSIKFPKKIDEAQYKLLRWNLEYRKKCMNQGFDNLLELLDKHWETWKDVAAETTPTPAPARTEDRR